MERVHGGARPPGAAKTASPQALQGIACRQTPLVSSPEYIVEKLRRELDLSIFDCGSPALNTWLRKFAWLNHQADSAKTYVALRENRVAGYYALTTGSVHKHESPERIAKGLANHPVGVVLLARLAVDVTEKGKGLGKALLF